MAEQKATAKAETKQKAGAIPGAGDTAKSDANQQEQPGKTQEELDAEKKQQEQAEADRKKAEQEESDRLAQEKAEKDEADRKRIALIGTRAGQLLALGYVKSDDGYQFGPTDEPDTLDYHEVLDADLELSDDIWEDVLKHATTERDRIRDEENYRNADREAKDNRQRLHEERQKKYGPDYVVAQKGSLFDVFSRTAWNNLSKSPDGSRDGWRQEVVTPPEVLDLQNKKHD